MSWQCTSWALREAPCPTSTARLVLIALADRCQPDGRSAWPTVETLAQEAHTSESSVRRALKELESSGAIRRGNQELAQWDEHGEWVPPQYRSTVWECCMGVALEAAAEKPGRQARLERAARKTSSSGSVDVPVSGPVKLEGPENAGAEPEPRPVKLTGLDGEIVSRPSTGDRSRPSTGDTPIYKTNTQTNNPSVSFRDISPDCPDGLVSLMAGLLLLPPCLPVPSALSDPSRRDLAVMGRLVESHSVGEVECVIRWALTPCRPEEDPKAYARGRGFWRSRIGTVRRLAAKWDELRLQMAADRLAGGGWAPPDRKACPPHLVERVPGTGREVHVYGFGRVPGPDARPVLDEHYAATMDADQCSVCGTDWRNRASHGVSPVRPSAEELADYAARHGGRCFWAAGRKGGN